VKFFTIVFVYFFVNFLPLFTNKRCVGLGLGTESVPSCDRHAFEVNTLFKWLPCSVTLGAFLVLTPLTFSDVWCSSANQVPLSVLQMPNPRPPPVNDEQKELLLGFMESNVLFSQGEFRCAMGKEDYRNEWERLAKALNAIPHGANKSGHKWQTVCMPHLNLSIP